ncbi:hypothetical protein ACKZJ7_03635 [Leptospira sp. 'Mane']
MADTVPSPLSTKRGFEEFEAFVCCAAGEARSIVKASTLSDGVSFLHCTEEKVMNTKVADIANLVILNRVIKLPTYLLDS